MLDVATRVLGVAAAVLLLCATPVVCVDEIIYVYRPYYSGVIALGAFVLGVIIVLAIMCVRWDAATIQLQPRERRIWEAGPPADATKDDIKILERLNQEADHLRKRPKEKRSASQAGQSDGAVNTASRGGQRSASAAVSPSNRSGGRQAPSRRAEDDVMAFNAAPPSRVSFR